MKTSKASLWAGFTLVEIMIVVAIIGLLAAIAVPNFVRARATSQANAWINNLRQLNPQSNSSRSKKGKNTGDPINYPDDLTPYIKLNSASSIPSCPAGGSYRLIACGFDPADSLFAQYDVDPPHTLQ